MTKTTSNQSNQKTCVLFCSVRDMTTEFAATWIPFSQDFVLRLDTCQCLGVFDFFKKKMRGSQVLCFHFHCFQLFSFQGSLVPGSHLPLCTDMDGLSSRQTVHLRKCTTQRFVLSQLGVSILYERKEEREKERRKMWLLTDAQSK